ncbi:hypothetical protein R70331_20025 [Paenibacillus sp. FSL R7-0331]|nr:hypothetical protein R70331_20025 [Paenibacillus sp. FSL R7-0331]
MGFWAFGLLGFWAFGLLGFWAFGLFVFLVGFMFRSASNRNTKSVCYAVLANAFCCFPHLGEVMGVTEGKFGAGGAERPPESFPQESSLRKH